MRRLAAAAVGATALAAASVASAVVEPGGGSSFGSGTDGWASTLATCQPTGGAIGEACSATNSHDPGAGNPPGSLRSRLTLDIGLLLFESDYAWRSPSFRVPGEPEEAVSGAEFTYDRRFDAGDLINLDPVAEVDATVVDETAGSQLELIEEELDSDDDSFETRTIAVPTGTLTREHIHHVELHASISTNSAQSGVSDDSSDVHFDNVALDIPDPPGNSEGVTFPRPPKTRPEIVALMGSLDLDALGGNGPGGSQVPLDECTILGTPGADRMRATRADDVVCGLGGNDTITARGGRDVVDTGDGRDTTFGNQGGDLMLGLRGVDLLRGRKGKDDIGGGADHDKIYGQTNADLIAAVDDARDFVQAGPSHKDRARVDRRDRVKNVEHLQIR